MTNEETIEMLDDLLGMIEDNHGRDYDTALHKGIEALRGKEAFKAELLNRLGVSERFNADVPAWVIGVIKGM